MTQSNPTEALERFVQKGMEAQKAVNQMLEKTFADTPMVPRPLNYERGLALDAEAKQLDAEAERLWAEANRLRGLAKKKRAAAYAAFTDTQPGLWDPHDEQAVAPEPATGARGDEPPPAPSPAAAATSGEAGCLSSVPTRIWNFIMDFEDAEQGYAWDIWDWMTEGKPVPPADGTELPPAWRTEVLNKLRELAKEAGVPIINWQEEPAEGAAAAVEQPDQDAGGFGFDEIALRQPPGEIRKCEACGCTEEDCRQCVEKTGKPCHWVAPNLCSACVLKFEDRKLEDAKSYHVGQFEELSEEVLERAWAGTEIHPNGPASINVPADYVSKIGKVLELEPDAVYAITQIAERASAKIYMLREVLPLEAVNDETVCWGRRRKSNPKHAPEDVPLANVTAEDREHEPWVFGVKTICIDVPRTDWPPAPAAEAEKPAAERRLEIPAKPPGQKQTWHQWANSLTGVLQKRGVDVGGVVHKGLALTLYNEGLKPAAAAERYIATMAAEKPAKKPASLKNVRYIGNFRPEEKTPKKTKKKGGK